MTSELKNGPLDSSTPHSPEEERFLCFSLGQGRFAMILLQVREVIAAPQFTHIPYSPPYFCGIMNLRGKVISVIDLRIKFGIPPLEKSENTIIICEMGDILMGVLVDSVDFVVPVSKEHILAKPTLEHNIKSDYISGFYYYKNETIVMLDLSKTLGDMRSSKV